MGKSLSKAVSNKATNSSNKDPVSSIKVPVSEKTQEQFAIESQITGKLLKERNAERKEENQIIAAEAERLAAKEAERLAAYEELKKIAKRKPILNEKNIQNIQNKSDLSFEEFKKDQEKQSEQQSEEQIEEQIKENQIERRKQVMATLFKNKIQKSTEAQENPQQKSTEAQENPQQKTDGGNNKNKPSIIVRKEILGKERCIYKKTGDRKEYVKYKGNLITVKDYKKIIKARNNKKI
jgi:hypothetical protein